jgi:hypothetical protein
MGRCLPQAPAFYFWFPPEEPFHCLRFASRQLRQRVTHSLGRRRQRGWQRAWRPLAAAVAALPVRSCVIDGELTACDTSGVPNFRALHFNSRDDVRYVWAFNLLYLNGKDLRPLPLVDRTGAPGTTRVQRFVSLGCATPKPSRMAPPYSGQQIAWALRASSRKRLPRPTDPEASATGSRSSAQAGARPTGSDGACLSAASVRRFR